MSWEWNSSDTSGHDVQKLIQLNRELIDAHEALLYREAYSIWQDRRVCVNGSKKDRTADHKEAKGLEPYAGTTFRRALRYTAGSQFMGEGQAFS